MEEKTFGTLLLEHLGETDRSQRWLAGRLGVSPATVSRWCNDANTPSDAATVQRIADALAVHGAARVALLRAAGFVVVAGGGEGKGPEGETEDQEGDKKAGERGGEEGEGAKTINNYFRDIYGNVNAGGTQYNWNGIGRKLRKMAENADNKFDALWEMYFRLFERIKLNHVWNGLIGAIVYLLSYYATAPILIWPQSHSALDLAMRYVGGIFSISLIVSLWAPDRHESSADNDNAWLLVWASKYIYGTATMQFNFMVFALITITWHHAADIHINGLAQFTALPITLFVYSSVSNTNHHLLINKHGRDKAAKILLEAVIPLGILSNFIYGIAIYSIAKLVPLYPEMMLTTFWFVLFGMVMYKKLNEKDYPPLMLVLIWSAYFLVLNILAFFVFDDYEPQPEFEYWDNKFPHVSYYLVIYTASLTTLFVVAWIRKRYTLSLRTLLGFMGIEILIVLPIFHASNLFQVFACWIMILIGHVLYRRRWSSLLPVHESVFITVLALIISVLNNFYNLVPPWPNALLTGGLWLAMVIWLYEPWRKEEPEPSAPESGQANTPS